MRPTPHSTGPEHGQAQADLAMFWHVWVYGPDKRTTRLVDGEGDPPFFLSKAAALNWAQQRTPRRFRHGTLEMLCQGAEYCQTLPHHEAMTYGARPALLLSPDWGRI